MCHPRYVTHDRRPDPLLDNAALARALRSVADLLDIRADDPHRANAYRRAAEVVGHAATDLVPAARAGTLPRLPGVGPSIARQLLELATTGRLGLLDGLRRDTPQELMSLASVMGVGPRRAGRIWRALGAVDLSDLEQAAGEGRLREVEGIGPALEAHILRSVVEMRRQPVGGLAMGEAWRTAERLVRLAAGLAAVRRAICVGDLRRGCERIAGIELLLETDKPERTRAELARLPLTRVAPAEGEAADDGSDFQLDGRIAVRIVLSTPDRMGLYLVRSSGSAAHWTGLEQRARRLGWELSDPGAMPPLPTEEALYASLGLAFVPPELREDGGEIEAAEAGLIPRLVGIDDLQGDCHSHSDWSDGHEPIETMAEAARERGYAWLVLTDHSHSLTIAHGLDPARVEEQRRVVGRLNETYARQEARGEVPAGAHPDGFRLLHGCELEITLDGRLDHPAALLARFDVVVASLHVGRRQPRERLMERYMVALRDQDVDIIAHPSGRKLGRRADLDLDWDAFYRAAGESGTLLEINGSDERLDLAPWRIREAAEAGCHFVIDSDAHWRDELDNVRFGVAMARRGRLGPGRVVNTLSRGAFLARLSARR